MTADEIDREISIRVKAINAGKGTAADWSRLRELTDMRVELLMPKIFRKNKNGEEI